MPKEIKPQQRTQSRRAASKEALKQMHILLDDESKYEISSDDDDVIEVDVQPPKKKYKLSHRKSSDGNERDVIVLKSVDEPYDPFDLEVVIEDLQPCQKTRHDHVNKENQEIEAKIQQLVTSLNTEVIYNGVYNTAVEVSEHLQPVISAANAAPPLTPYTIPAQSNSVSSPASTSQSATASQGIVLQQQPAGTNTIPQSYQLVMDPRLGVIVGTVTTPGAASPNTPPLQLYPSKVIPSTTTTTSNADATTMKTRRGTMLRPVSNSAMPPLQPTNQAVHLQKTTPQQQAQAKPMQMKRPMMKPKSTITAKPITALKQQPATRTPTNTTSSGPFRPTESNVEGGLSMGKPSKSIDLTSEDGRALPDSREVSFNKLQGRTYPSLVVVARPHLRVKDLAADRGKLDVKVKSVLMYPPTKFTEWLIQQGLVRSEQKCSIHSSNPLKLGMYSDASKFPYSGGYVWISECCPQRFVSVFSGSIFEGSQHPPMAILKLLYHWCCQTIVQNVTQWVKVDNLYVKGMYTWLRAICTVALHTHIKQLGGPGVKVQVGVISLGTTSQDGNKREVKVEVLGILETTTRHIRLRAVEPLADGERNYKKRFTKILEPVFNWVHPSSIIVTDLTVDKATLHQMGFLNVTQSTSTDYSQSNRTIMEYLRRIVPRMFQNTLSLLSRQIIQQFLDELVWREWYGTTVLQCFDNMVQHLSEQTRHDGGQSLITRLNKISANPFKNWSIPLTNSTTNTTALAAPKTIEPQQTPKRYSRQRKPITPQPPPAVTQVQEVVRPAKSTSPDVPEQMVPLESYYYGTITPDSQQSRNKITINIKCPFCKLSFNTNIALMNHLFKHAHNVSNDVQLCKYCLTIVPTANDLLKHIGTSHPDETKFDSGFVCLICETHFRNPFILGKHMSKEHCPSELPYMCGTCSFRCSNHKQAVDHFYQQHDHGTTIQCPFCLKSTTIFSGGRNISQNMNYFIQHLQKHQKKHLAKRCGRCTLWFIQKEFLKDHQTKMHISQRGKAGLLPCFAPRNGIMVPKSRMDKCPDDAKVINFSTLHFTVGKNLNCKECEKPLMTPKHFASFESCQNPNCQFATCCTVAMQEHAAKCKFLNSKLPMEKLPYEMHCICGYSDIYGNQMAKHLAICERKSAYPSRQAAKDATVTHSMLDVLGLVRKPEEATSSKEPKKVETNSVQPIILKRGRPRKFVSEANKQPAKEVLEVKDDAQNRNEVRISISEVRGGVDCDIKDEEKASGEKTGEEVSERVGGGDEVEEKGDAVGGKEKENESENVKVVENEEKSEEVDATKNTDEVKEVTEEEIAEKNGTDDKKEDEAETEEKSEDEVSKEGDKNSEEEEEVEKSETDEGIKEEDRSSENEEQGEKIAENEEAKSGDDENGGEDKTAEEEEKSGDDENVRTGDKTAEEEEEKSGDDENVRTEDKAAENEEEKSGDDESVRAEDKTAEKSGDDESARAEEKTAQNEGGKSEDEGIRPEDKNDDSEEVSNDNEDDKPEDQLETHRGDEQEKEDDSTRDTPMTSENENTHDTNLSENSGHTADKEKESEVMDIETCKKVDGTVDETVAIENSTQESTENFNDICPMDTE